MQIEAGMAAITAVQEMLIHSVKDVIRIFPGVPSWWRDVSFSGMRAEGAFLIDAKMVGGKIARVKVFSEKGSHLRIENNIAKAVLVKRDINDTEEIVSDDIIEISTHPGETITLMPEPVD